MQCSIQLHIITTETQAAGKERHPDTEYRISLVAENKWYMQPFCILVNHSGL